MITRITGKSELKKLFVEDLLNKTNSVTKVSDQSVLNGVAYGVASIAQKALKDIALVETHLFPEFAFGSHLDTIAERMGVAARLGASKSSTYIRVTGSPGTIYTAGTQVFSGSGKDFDLVESLTIGASGFAYVKVRSVDTGTIANVDALTITTVTPAPSGHTYCLNEYAATGGRDLEDDTLLKRRIRNAGNLAARGTVAYLTQTFQKLNSDVLDVYYQGINASNQSVLAISTQNGIDLTTTELDSLLERAEEYLSLTELSPIGGAPNIELKNIEYQAIDIAFRVELDPSANTDEVRKEIQIQISNYFDYRFWNRGTNIEWDDLLQIVKSNPSVRYVPDTQFIPNSDIVGDISKLPRVRGFIMMDVDGNIISNVSGTLNPIYYPADASLSFDQTIISSI